MIIFATTIVICITAVTLMAMWCFNDNQKQVKETMTKELIREYFERSKKDENSL